MDREIVRCDLQGIGWFQSITSEIQIWKNIFYLVQSEEIKLSIYESKKTPPNSSESNLI